MTDEHTVSAAGAPPETEGELVLEPPHPVPAVSAGQAESAVKVDPQTAQRIESAVGAFADSLLGLEPNTPAFEQKVRSVSEMGNADVRRSAEVSNRFLQRPAAELGRGPLAQGSGVSTSLLALRRQIEDLDPSRALGNSRRFLGLIPARGSFRDYFHKYQSAQANIEAIVQGLYRGQDELMRDNASIEQEKANLWEAKGRLEQYCFMASRLDEAVSERIGRLEAEDPARAAALKQDVLFYVRQKRQDLLTQLAVNMQAYLALDLIRKNNVELIKGVDRATTTTVSALRTAVIAALALNNQRLVLDQVTALNTTTGNLIESTSQMLRQQSGEIQQQAASATVSVEKLQAAFNNVYATIDSIDTFKVAALESMRTTVDTLTAELGKADRYLERARSADTAAATGELALPAKDLEV